MYSKRQTWTNSEDPDQTPQNAASDQGLHSLPLKGSKMELFKASLR